MHSAIEPVLPAEDAQVVVNDLGTRCATAPAGRLLIANAGAVLVGGIVATDQQRGKAFDLVVSAGLVLPSGAETGDVPPADQRSDVAGHDPAW